MRSAMVKLCALATLSLGAASTTSCESLLASLIGDSLVPDLSIRVRILNDAYVPVSVQLVSGEGDIQQAAVVLAAEGTDGSDETDGTGDTDETGDPDATDDAEDTDGTDQTADGTLDPGQEQTLTFLCGALPPALAVKATVAGQGGNLPSATSQILRSGVHYECGDRIEFTVRSVAGGGLVVGASVDEGGA